VTRAFSALTPWTAPLGSTSCWSSSDGSRASQMGLCRVAAGGVLGLVGLLAARRAGCAGLHPVALVSRSLLSAAIPTMVFALWALCGTCASRATRRSGPDGLLLAAFAIGTALGADRGADAHLLFGSVGLLLGTGLGGRGAPVQPLRAQRVLRVAAYVLR